MCTEIAAEVRDRKVGVRSSFASRIGNGTRTLTCAQNQPSGWGALGTVRPQAV